MEIVITGGELRGRRLIVPDNIHVRPTMSLIRESIFNSLGDRIFNSKFLDLFAGFGTVGIEALSRGAESVTFVEKNKKSVGIIRKGIEIFDLSGRADIFNMSVERFLQITNSVYNIIYLDPPYMLDCSDLVLEILDKKILADDGIIIWETSVRSDINKKRFNTVKEKRYGETVVLYIEYEESGISREF
ncbi:MAG TPA: 16S rRNA (guanine(966)-N(2))-methyltransferase RsmD [bacterium]|nr:16S rRNA (guanine(966)-N(2))-methyltransferase RsmD [bacterium]